MERGLQTRQGDWEEHPFLTPSQGTGGNVDGRFQRAVSASPGEMSHQRGSRGGQLPAQAGARCQVPGASIWNAPGLRLLLLGNSAAGVTPRTPFPRGLCTR